MAPGELAFPSWTNGSGEERQSLSGTTAEDRDLHELLTVEEVAALLKVSKSWVYEHTRSRGVPRSERLPHLKLGKYVRFDAEAVRGFLNRRCKVM
jgi:excisionase family DNA binding protein